MPRAFDTQEQKTIRAALIEAGRTRFVRAGLRAARIDDLCVDVGIAKGSFYRFYASKEDLFMAVANEQDLMHKRDIRAYVETHPGPLPALLGGFFDMLMARVETDPILSVVRDTGELQTLMRKVSPDLLADNARADRLFLDEMAAFLNTHFPHSAISTALLEQMMTLMLTLGLQKSFISQMADYPATVALLRELFIARLSTETTR